MGKRPRSTSLPSRVTACHGADFTVRGAMSRTRLKIGSDFQASRIPLGGSGALRNASSRPISRRAPVESAPIASATRRGVPNRFASTGMSWFAGYSNSSAGPAARSVRSHTSVISRYGSMGLVMRLSSPCGSRAAERARREIVVLHRGAGRRGPATDRPEAREEPGAPCFVMNRDPGVASKVELRDHRGVIGRPVPFCERPDRCGTTCSDARARSMPGPDRSAAPGCV